MITDHLRRALTTIVLLLAAAVAGCDTSGEPSTTTTLPVTAAEPLELSGIVERLTAGDAAIIEGFDATVPAVIPERAAALAAFPVGAGDDAGFSGGLVVASVRPTQLEINVLCIDATAQVACSAQAGGWSLAFGSPQGSIVDVSGGQSQPPQGVLLVVARDEQRAVLVSRGFWIAGPPDTGRSASGRRYQHDPVLGGCGIAPLLTDLEPRSTFVPLLESPITATVYLVVQICADANTTAIVPLLVIDSKAVEVLRPGGVRVEPGRSYVFEVDLDEYRDAERLQAFVLPDPGPEAWVSWPLQLSR